MRKARTKRVLTAMTWEMPGQRIGIVRYARQAGWIVRGANPFNYQAIAEWQPDAVICQLHPDSKHLVQAIRAANVMKVELHAYIPTMKMPRIMVDTAALGAAAADHFIERKFRRLFLVGQFASRKSVDNTSVGFQQRAKEAGLAAEVIDLDIPSSLRERGINIGDDLTWSVKRQGAQAVIRWIARTKEPAGLFCGSSEFALDMEDAAIQMGVDMPLQVAILAESYPPHMTELAPIPLSWISWDFEAQGYLSALTLDRMLRGETVPDVQWIAPSPVQVRESTDVIASRFPPAAAAFKHFRDHALEYEFTTDRASRDLEVCTATLYRWFRLYAGTTPAKMIEDRRLTHAINLMQYEQASTEDAARRAGFSGARQLRRALSRQGKQGPGPQVEGKGRRPRQSISLPPS